MICIDTATYSESVIWTPNFGSGASRGPMQKAMTYIVRPDIAPRYCSVMTVFISRGSIQLFVGPASSRDWEQMNVLSSTRATSSGSEDTPERVRLAVQAHERAFVDEQIGQAIPFGAGPVAPDHLTR